MRIPALTAVAAILTLVACDRSHEPDGTKLPRPKM